MPAVPLTESSLERQTGTAVVKYPNPFFDLANNSLPKDIKTLFKYCRDFFYTNAFLRNVVKKLTEYPVTDILYNDTIKPDEKRQYDLLLHGKLKIKSFLMGLGQDYFTYGNAFVSVYLLPKRFLRCTACGHIEPMNTSTFTMKENFKIVGKCKKCQNTAELKIQDELIPTVENFKLVRWDPENIDIEWDPLTNSATYFYKMPQKTKSDLLKGNKTLLQSVPLIFIEAIRSKKRIEMDPNNFYHFKAPGLAEENMAWGKPLILPAIKDIYYLQTLRRGNEAIANEHIVPKKAVFPANTTTMDPFTQMNLGKWRSQIEEQMKKWKSDPNHIGIFPIPIGYQELGGNAKMLLLTPEMKFMEETIINSLGVPLEFIKGGASWTGSSISLRIVENGFLTYRELLSDFLNYFLVQRIADIFKIPVIKLKFKEFKMSDDEASKQLMLQLSQMQKISDARLLDSFGLDYQAEELARKQAINSYREDQIINARNEAEAQGEAQLVAAKYQAQAQQAMEQESFKWKLKLFENEMAQENIAIPEDPYILITKWALEILNLPTELQEQRWSQLARKTPITYSLVVERFKSLQIQQMQQEQAIAPPPQQSGPRESNNKKEPGTREQDKVKVRSKEKTKGQTRGTP